jgi:hypothetical protein
MNTRNMATLRLVLATDKNRNVPNRFNKRINKTENGSHGLRSHKINPQYENTLYHGSIRYINKKRVVYEPKER